MFLGSYNAKKNGGGGGRKISKFFFPSNFFFKNVPGVLKRTHRICFWGGGVFGAPHAPTRGSRWVGKQYTSSYDRDRLKFWNGPETLAAEE